MCCGLQGEQFLHSIFHLQPRNTKTASSAPKVKKWQCVPVLKEKLAGSAFLRNDVIRYPQNYVPNKRHGEKRNKYGHYLQTI